MGSEALPLRDQKHLEGPLPTCWAVTLAFLRGFVLVTLIDPRGLLWDLGQDFSVDPALALQLISQVAALDISFCSPIGRTGPSAQHTGWSECPMRGQL